MDKRIKRVLDHIERQLGQQFSLDELASTACMSPSNFHRVFKKETFRTPFQFIEEMKMGKAFQQLTSASVKVHELTQQLGYKDYETFSRAFKKHHAVAPDDLRAISLRIQKEAGVGPEGLIIKTIDVDKLEDIQTAMEQITEKLKELFIEKGYKREDLEKARVMPVMEKSIARGDELGMIKNKFVLTENKKIWEQLLKDIPDGND